MANDPRPLKIEDAITWAQRLRPHVNGAGALYVLLMQQTEFEMTVDMVIDAFDKVRRGEPLPPLGLSHQGVGLVQHFDATEWARLHPILDAVAQNAPPHTPAYVVEIAERLLATHEAMALPTESLQKIACALLDPTVPPMTPAMLDQALEELQLGFRATRATIRRLAPRCYTLVKPQLDLRQLAQ